MNKEPDEMVTRATRSTLLDRPQNSRSRPTSLVPLAPEKEALIFSVNLTGAPPEVENLIEHIKLVAEQFLYHWKTFPISIPSPLSSLNNSFGQFETSQQNESSQLQNTNRKSRSFSLRDLFVTPSFDELEAVAMDGIGEPRRLTASQLKTLRDQGEFEVPSLNFPGQVHRWQLSQFLQKGYLRTRETLLKDLALAAHFIFITAKARIFGHFFSVVKSARAFLHGILLLVDMVIGIPSLMAHDLDNKIREERCRYLVAELICRPEYEDCLDTLCAHVRRQLHRATTEKFDVDCEMMASPIPYLFLTPKGLEIDLRLFSRDIMQKALPILVNILERERRGWFLHFRERLIADLRDKKMSDTEIEERVNEAVMQEYLQRVYSSILNHSDLAQLGIQQLLVQQAQSVVIMHRAIEKVKKDIKQDRSDYQRLLAKDYPVLSKIKPWLDSKLETAESTKAAKSVWLAYEEALKMSQKHSLQQSAYFLSRDMAFMKEREPVLRQELLKVTAPTRNFQWNCRIWSPKSWIVRRSFQGYAEVIQTVVCQQATSIVTPRSDPNQPVFLVEKEITRTNSTRWPFWRILNLMQRIWCYTWNMMYLLGYVVPWDSPLGFRALFCIKPFMPGLELSQVNGSLFPKKASITHTLISRLIELWRHISKARTRFETEPDTGFIGKGMTRALNRIWNYFFKGFVCTMGIVIFFPILCVTVSITSILFALATPIWIPFSMVLLHLYMMFVYDLDSPNDLRNRYCIFLEAILWNIFIQGCVQPILAVIVAGFVCPLAAMVVFFVGIIRYWFRHGWDYITFHLFIKKCAKIPSSDSLAVKRIAGPGLIQNYYYSIKPEQALAAFEAKMELDELTAFQQSMENQIFQPKRDFKQFIEACFGPFSAQLDKKAGPYCDLERESRDLLNLLNEKLERRRRDLQTGLSANVKNRIKLHPMELKVAIQHGAHLLERFYPEHVIGRLSMTEEEFWDSKGIQMGDWAGLAAQLYTDIFSLDFLTPLSESDTQFKLEPQSHLQLPLTHYTEMVQYASDTMGFNGPDLLGNVYAPRGNIHVNSPYLEVSAFNPRSKLTMVFSKTDKSVDTGSSSRKSQKHTRRNLSSDLLNNDTCLMRKRFSWTHWKRWKRKPERKNIALEKMQIPLPIPHPVCIAIEIYNRDSDDPIPLDSDICWEILKAAEEANGEIQPPNYVARYRGGGGGDEFNVQTGESMGSLLSDDNNGGGDDDDAENDDDDDDDTSDRDDEISEREICLAAYDKKSMAIGGDAETLPCGVAAVSDVVVKESNSDKNPSSQTFHWTLSNWGPTQTHRRNDSGTVRVDLASPEDISLDTDNSSRVVFSSYGTNV